MASMWVKSFKAHVLFFNSIIFFHSHTAASVPQTTYFLKKNILKWVTKVALYSPPSVCVRAFSTAALIKLPSSPDWKPFPDKYPGSRNLLPWTGVPCKTQNFTSMCNQKVVNCLRQRSKKNSPYQLRRSTHGTGQHNKYRRVSSGIPLRSR